jgi:hypothetical protein
MTTSRTFIVRVSESPRRVVIEDVRERQQALVGDLGDIGAQIEAWLVATRMTATEAGPSERDDSASGSP